MTTVDDSPQSPKARGQRLRYIREELLGFSRRKFAERHKDKKLTINNLQNMEDGRFKGMKIEHIELLIPALKDEGIQCSKRWLLEGIGDPPKFYSYAESSLQDDSGQGRPANLVLQTQSDDIAIAAELRIFREYHFDAIDAVVSDAALEPCIFKGDYVAGIRYTGEAIKEALNCFCIIQMQDGRVLTRKLMPGDTEGLYTLVGFKPNQKKHTILNVKIFSAAPIIWHRIPLLFFKR